MLLGLGLLDTDDIRIAFLHPVKKALAGGGADAVGINTDNSHGLGFLYFMMKHGSITALVHLVMTRADCSQLLKPGPSREILPRCKIINSNFLNWPWPGATSSSVSSH